MSIYIDSALLCLLKQHLQIPQIMARNKNAGTLSHTNIYFCNLGVAIGIRVGFIQQSHTADAVFTCFHCERNEIIHSQGIIQCCGQSSLQKGVDLPILLHECIGMFGIGGQSF